MEPQKKLKEEKEEDVRVSGPFLGWIISLGEGVKIVGPDEVVEQMRLEIERLTRQYIRGK